MDYEKLMLKIKNNYFPELKDVTVRVKPSKFKFFRISVMGTFPPIKNIYYNEQKIKKYNNRNLQALFAHTLAHIAQTIKLNLFQLIYFHLRYLINLNYRSKIEKEADLLVIKKGFGESLVTARKLTNKLESKNERERRKKAYYSIKNLKKLVRKRK